MKHPIQILLGLFFLAMVGCGPVMYSTVGHNVPLFQEKGEFYGQIGYSSTNGAWTAEGVGAKAGYAVSDKIQLTSSFYSMKNFEDPGNDEWKGKGNYWEVGGGWYGGFTNPRFRYEAVGGFGSGKIKNTSRITSGEFINAKFIKPYVQPSVGFVSRYFEAAISPRISYLSYSDQEDFNLITEANQSLQEFFDVQSNKLVFEPGLTLRGGYQSVMLELQYSYSFLKESSPDYYLINNEYLSIGVRFLIGNRDYFK